MHNFDFYSLCLFFRMFVCWSLMSVSKVSSNESPRSKFKFRHQMNFSDHILANIDSLRLEIELEQWLMSKNLSKSIKSEWFASATQFHPFCWQASLFQCVITNRNLSQSKNLRIENWRNFVKSFEIIELILAYFFGFT